MAPRELPVGAYLPGNTEPGIVPEPPAETADPADRAVAREHHAQRVNDFARLKAREREALYLKALGHSYQEIAALTNASYTAVNRRINEGRARLRKLARERDVQTGAGAEEGGEDPPQGA